MSVIRGATITTPIARSAVVDDKSVSNKPWSSKHLLDVLCPSFSKSGSIVTCEPVEGYPLEVVSAVNPNLITEDITGESPWAYDEEAGNPVYDAGEFPAGTYTIYVEIVGNEGDPGYIHVVCNSDTGIYSVYHKEPKTFIHNGGKILLHDIMFPQNIQCVKLEVGTEYTGTDYASTLTRTGKNVFGGDALADALESKDNGKGVTKNEADKTVTFDPGLMTRTGHLFNKFKENTQYTIILYGYATASGGAVNIRVQYTDETAESLYFGTAAKPNPANEPGYCIHKTNPNKTVWRITPQWVGQKTVLYYDQCGVFEGNVSTAEFEAYRAETFPVGENVPALPGVNTLWADKNDITVAGRADPVAIINKLTNATASLSSDE